MIEIRVATLGDLWRFLAARKSQPSEREYELLLFETLADRVLAALEDGSPIALGGVLTPSDDLPGTAWFSVLPEAGRRIVPIAKAMRRVIEGVSAVWGPGLVCCVRQDNPKGARLVAALGGRRNGREQLGLVEWSFDGGRWRDDHGARGQEAGAACRAGAGAPGG